MFIQVTAVDIIEEKSKLNVETKYRRLSPEKVNTIMNLGVNPFAYSVAYMLHFINRKSS